MQRLQSVLDVLERLHLRRRGNYMLSDFALELLLLRYLCLEWGDLVQQLLQSQWICVWGKRGELHSVSAWLLQRIPVHSDGVRMVLE